MPGIATAIEDILVATLVSGKIFFPHESRTDWLLKALSALFCVAGVFLSVLGLVWYLAERYPPDMAAFGSAAVVFIAAALAWAAASLCRHRKPPVFEAVRSELGKNLHALMAGLCDELDAPLQENPKTAVLLAALAGFFSARLRADL